MAEIPDTVDEALDDLSSPTTAEVLLATIDFPVRDIAVEAAKRAGEGGGGGGGSGLPTGWTEDGEDPSNVSTNGDVGENTGTLSLGSVFLSAGEVSTPFVVLPGDNGDPAPARFRTPHPSMPSAEFRGAGQSAALAIFGLVEPADGDLENGECGLWFDNTNGAPALMVKAKSADGTVAVGSIPLPGGGLPAWWTIDSAPGEESATFAGVIAVATDQGDPFRIADLAHGGNTFAITDELLRVNLPLLVQGQDWTVDDLVLVKDTDNNELVKVALTGETAITPDAGATEPSLLVKAADANQPLLVRTPAGDDASYLDRFGGLTLIPRDEFATLQISNMGDADLGSLIAQISPSTNLLRLQAADAHAENLLLVTDHDLAELFTVGPTGTVEITPSADVVGLRIKPFASENSLVISDSSDHERFTVSQGTMDVRDSGGVSAWSLSESGIQSGGDFSIMAGSLGFFGAFPVAQPEIPATPTAQDIADVLVALGLATQAA